MKLKTFFHLLFFTFLMFCKCHAEDYASAEDAEVGFSHKHSKACYHYNHQHWHRAREAFQDLIKEFPYSQKAKEDYFFLGVCYFELRDYDFANAAFSDYLAASPHPEFFERTMEYKFFIAEHFRKGGRRRLFKFLYCPKWASARSLALSIYDEIIVTMPNHPLAGQALISKGILLQSMNQFKESIDAFQTFIRRFPKHEMTPDCYLKIAEIYCQEGKYDYQNPDILALAEINLRRFQEDFPRDEKIEIAKAYVRKIKEMSAKGLCDIGVFYERARIPTAAAVYYQCAVDQFPDTRVASFCRCRLERLGYTLEEEEPILFNELSETPAIPEANECQEEVESLEESTCPLPNLEDTSS